MPNDLGKPPVWFWVVAGASLLWSLVGCFVYVTQVSMDAAEIAKLPQGQQDIWNMIPAWVTGAYAIAVWVGLAGSIALLLRKAWARPLFIMSLVAVIVQFGWVFLATPILETLGPSSSASPAFIFVVAALLVWFSGMAIQRGWLR